MTTVMQTYLWLDIISVLPLDYFALVNGFPGVIKYVLAFFWYCHVVVRSYGVMQSFSVDACSEDDAALEALAFNKNLPLHQKVLCSRVSVTRQCDYFGLVNFPVYTYGCMSAIYAWTLE